MTVKTMEIDAGVDPALRELIEQAEPLIERMLGNAVERAEVEWVPCQTGDVDEPTVRLRLTDSGVSRTEEFSADELDDDVRFGRRFRELWDKVLAERIRIQLRRVYESLGTIEEGNGG